MNIGFIGLGNMGQGMARNLLSYCQAKGYALTVFDINETAMQTLVKLGARQADCVADIAKTSQVLFTSLPSSKQVNAIALGSNGVLQNLPQGGLWFETSTSELGQWQVVLDAAPTYLTLIDAPVTGGREGAAAGALTMLLGLDIALSPEMMSLLGSMTNKTVIVGTSGAGYVAKLCQLHLNYLVAQGIGEALMLGAKSNLDLDVLSDVLSHSCAQSYVVDNYIPKILDGSYDPSFTLGLAKKDMSLIHKLGAHLDVDLPLSDLVHRTYESAVTEYGSDAPHLSIVKLIEEKMNSLLRSEIKAAN